MKSGGRQQLWTQLNEVRRDWVSQPPVLVEVSKAQIRRVERLDFDGLPEGSNWRPARSPCGFTSPTRPSGNWPALAQAISRNRGQDGRPPAITPAREDL
jgi:hypothetical protein